VRELTSEQRATLEGAYEALKAVADHDDGDGDDKYCLVCRHVEIIAHDPSCPIGRAISAIARKIYGLHDVPRILPDGYVLRVDRPDEIPW
jgi:hypothetical protein